MLLTAEPNHNTCLEEITAGSTGVLKGLCFIKTEVSVQAVTSTYTHTYTSICADVSLYLFVCAAAAVWVIIMVWLIEFREKGMLMLFHPPWKINDTANPIPPSVSLFPYRWMNLNQLKNWARPFILLPPLAAFIGKSKNCQFDIYSWSALGEKKNPTLSLFLFYSLSVSLNPLMVTLLDFGNLRLGVKMAARGDSSHPGWLPQCWLLDHAKQAKCRRYENRTG